MKKTWVGALLGVALCLGNSAVSYGQSAESIIGEQADTEDTDYFEAGAEIAASEESGASEKNSWSDLEDSSVDFEQETDELDEGGFFCGSAETEAFSSENQEDTAAAMNLDEGDILSKIPDGATSVTLEAANGSDITESLNLLLRFMGERASDASPCTVIIPPGSYMISGTLHMYSNLCLYAEGARITKCSTNKHIVIRLGDNETSAGGYDGYRNITIEGGTWDFNYSVVENKEEKGGYVGFRIGHARNVTVKNVTFLNNLKSHFLELAGVENVLVTGCTFRGYWTEYEGGGQECIQLDACMDYIFPGYQPFDGAVCENVRIENNTFEDVFAGVGSHSMIYDRPYRGIVIRGNTFRNVKKRAVWCLNYVDSSVEDNLMENVGGGVRVSSMYLPNTYLAPGSTGGAEGNHQTAGITVKGNQISISGTSEINGASWRGYGIEILGARVTPGQSVASRGIPVAVYKETGVTVSGNTVTGTGNGIRLYLTDCCKITNNCLKLQRTAGFSNMGILLSASSQNVVNDNQVSGTKNVGIYAYNGGSVKIPSKKNQIRENALSATGGDGILVEADSTGTVVSRNKIASGKKNGVVVWGSQDCQITENQVSGCTLDGIYLENVGKAVIKSNKVSNVKGRGIQVISSQTKSLYGNTVSSCRKCGLYVSQSKISGNKKNRMESNGTSYAIYAEESSGIISVKHPTASGITRKSVKITGKAAGGKTLTIYAVSGNKNKKIGKGTIDSKKGYSIAIKKQKKGTVLRFVLTDKYGNSSYTNKKVK